MRRRAFIAALGGAAAGSVLAPHVARAQAAMPVVGFLYSGLPEPVADRLRAFRLGLKEAGYVEGENVAIAYRYAENQIDRLPEMAADLVRRRVTLIVTLNNVATLAVRAAVTTIPLVFVVNEDPVKLGLVASLARPGGNATGINFLGGELQAKRFDLLRELLPAATRVALLVNPANPTNTEQTVRSVGAAARTRGVQIEVFNASTGREIDAAFATLARERADALFVGGEAFFLNRRVQIVILAAQHSIPASYGSRESPEIGGLMSYGSNIADAWRQAGGYAGRILKGAKPADLPVVQSSKFELVINHQTARSLGLTVPPSLLATADEVIE